MNTVCERNLVRLCQIPKEIISAKNSTKTAV